MTNNHQLHINHAQIADTAIAVRPAPQLSADGEILCQIKRIALTANNITYAVTGDFLKYWDFFPTGEEGWGMVPVWGYADVLESRHPEIAAGERLYGYWPLANYLVIEPDKVSPRGFVDGAPHRQHLNLIYNQYSRTGNVPRSLAEEGMQAIYRPMFTTSFLLDDYLWDSASTAKTHIISSASSKTGYGTAFLLSANRAERAEYTIVGLTSSKNVLYVESLGLYDLVLAYDQVDQLPNRTEPAVYSDFSGNAKLRAQIHHHYGEQMIKDVVIGVTDWTQQGSAKGLPGARAEMFFAPSQAQKRLAEWGQVRFGEQLSSNLKRFIDFAGQNLTLKTVSDMESIQALWVDMVAGKVDPKLGMIVELG